MAYSGISKTISLFFISAFFGVFLLSVTTSADMSTFKQFENNIIDEIKTWGCLSSNPEAMTEFKNCVAPLLVSQAEIVAGKVGKEKGCRISCLVGIVFGFAFFLVFLCMCKRTESGQEGTRNIYDCIELISTKCPTEFEASVFPAKCINNPQ